MNLHIHRGLDQIGGNIIEVSTENTKILLDVGLDLDGSDSSSLPQIDGLFDFAGYDAIFISHYHGDHLGLAYYSHKDIPIYIGEASYRIIQASDNYKKQECIKPAGFLHSMQPIVVGNITITPYLCDHSAFDSYMLFCEANGETLLYTGDFRANGRKSFESLLRVLPCGVDKMLCEGTTLSRENFSAMSEKELENQAVELFSRASGPIFVLQSSMNVDRIVTMYRAAKRSRRIFLEEVYMADIATAAGENIPNPAFNDVYAFITSPSKFGLLSKYKRKAGKSFIAKKSFVMCVRNSMLRYMKSLSKKMSFKGGILVYSFWSGYKDTDDMKEFLSECKKLGLKIVTLHTSGHADEKAIKELIEKVKPKLLIPIHTENADRFKEIAPNVKIAE